MPGLQDTAPPPFDPAIVRDTIGHVFTNPAYNPSLRETLGDRLLAWIFRTIVRAFEALRGSADVRWIVIGVAVAVVALIVARAVYLARVGVAERVAARGRGRGAMRQADPWTRAQADAAAGKYSLAAHALYAGVLEIIAAHARVQLHPAKTAGEYRRELAARSPVLLPAFAEFTGEYELAIWRRGECDDRCFAELWRIAERIRSTETVHRQAA